MVVKQYVEDVSEGFLVDSGTWVGGLGDDENMTLVKWVVVNVDGQQASARLDGQVLDEHASRHGS